MEDGVLAGTINANYQVQDDADNDENFELWSCSYASSVLSCTHFQPRKQETYSENFRFEKYNQAKAYFYNNDDSEFLGTWITLESGVTLGVSAIATAVFASVF